MNVQLCRRILAATALPVVVGGGCAQVVGISAFTNGFCEGGKSQPCYTGPAGTENKGRCRGGMQTCLGDNSAWGPCEGEVLPDATDDCSGRICKTGETQSCYTGPAGTEGIGICTAGTQTCSSDGLSFGSCEGEVHPDPSNQNGGTCTDKTWAELFLQTNGADVDSMIVDGQGNVVVGGIFSGSMTFGGDQLVSSGLYDEFIVKFDASGKELWAKHIGDSAGQGFPVHVALDAAGDLAVSGVFSGTVDLGGGALVSSGAGAAFVAKYDAGGAYKWGVAFTNSLVSYVEADSLATDSKGNVILAGAFSGSLGFGGQTFTAQGDQTTPDGFLVELASDGTYLWSHQVGDAPGETQASQYVVGVGVDVVDDVLVLVSFEGSVRLGGQSFLATNGENTAIAKYDQAGNVAWAQAYGGTMATGPGSMAVDSSGDLIVEGYFSGTVNFGGSDLTDTQANASEYFFAVNGLGAYQWSMGVDFLNAHIVFGKDDGVVAGGKMFGPVDLGSGPIDYSANRAFFLGALDPTTGKPSWTKTFTATTMDSVSALAVDPTSGAVLVAGSVSDTVNFGTGPLTGIGIYLAKVPTTGF